MNDMNDMLNAVNISLPDVLEFQHGLKVRDAAQWRARRDELIEHILPIVYGVFPPPPVSTRCIELHAATVRHLALARLGSYQVEVDGRHAFLMRVLVPDGTGPFPVIVNGDACWHYATDQVLDTILNRGYALVQFNRVEVAADNPRAAQTAHSAIAHWAWAYHRAVDALHQLTFLDCRQIAVVGHSRGGKAALLAGATDERIALTSANNSGAGGAGCFRWGAPGAETLADIVDAFPHWFGPDLKHYAGREDELPLDQHFLKALIAPRALLTTEALGDVWANPAGTWLTYLAARRVYEFLGAGDQIATAYREGGHEHCLADWLVLLDYCDTVFRGAPRPGILQIDPFPHLSQKLQA